MNNTSIFGARLPEATDPAQVRQDLGFNAQVLENASKHSIALQNNSSTTTYTSDFPLVEYVNGHSFIFIPLYTCTGATTININSLGVKKIYLEDGTTQISNALEFQKGIQYLLTYDDTLNGGAGAFKSLRLSQYGVTQYFTGSKAYTADGTGSSFQVDAPTDCNYFELEIGSNNGLCCKVKYFLYPTTKTFSQSTKQAQSSTSSVIYPFTESNICYEEIVAGFDERRMTFTITKNTNGFSIGYIQSKSGSAPYISGTISVLGTARKE